MIFTLESEKPHELTNFNQRVTAAEVKRNLACIGLEGPNRVVLFDTSKTQIKYQIGFDNKITGVTLTEGGFVATDLKGELIVTQDGDVIEKTKVPTVEPKE